MSYMLGNEALPHSGPASTVHKHGQFGFWRGFFLTHLFTECLLGFWDQGSIGMEGQRLLLLAMQPVSARSLN